MSNAKQTVEKIIFVLFYLFSLFSMNSDKLGSYWGNNGTPYIFFRFALIILLMISATVINRNNLDFITKIVPPSALIITAIAVFDYYVTEFSGSQFLYRIWWIAYIIATQITVFIIISLFKFDNYKDFYRRFWLSFMPIYAFMLFLCFIRKPNDVLEFNFILGQGSFLMLKALINNLHVTFDAPLIFFGNFAVLIPMPLILSAISKKLTPPIIMLIGFLTPFIIEGQQLVLKCGQVDIDDIVLNFGGFLFSFLLLYIPIYKYKLNKDTA